MTGAAPKLALRWAKECSEIRNVDRGRQCVKFTQRIRILHSLHMDLKYLLNQHTETNFYRRVASFINLAQFAIKIGKESQILLLGLIVNAF